MPVQLGFDPLFVLDQLVQGAVPLRGADREKLSVEGNDEAIAQGKAKLGY